MVGNHIHELAVSTVRELRICILIALHLAPRAQLRSESSRVVSPANAAIAIAHQFVK